MIDIKLIRENSELVKENIKKKFQDSKLVLVDEVIDLDKIYAQKRAEIQNADQKAQAELKRRVEEDKKIQAAEMKEEKNASADGKGA